MLDIPVKHIFPLSGLHFHSCNGVFDKRKSLILFYCNLSELPTMVIIIMPYLRNFVQSHEDISCFLLKPSLFYIVHLDIQYN